MKLTIRISKEAVRELVNPTLAVINAQPDLTVKAREYLCTQVVDETERLINHAFAEGRLFERRNPVA